MNSIENFSIYAFWCFKLSALYKKWLTNLCRTLAWMHCFCFTFVTYYVRLNRSSRWRMFFKIGALKNLAIFTRKQLCWSFLKLGCRLGGCSWLQWNSLWKVFMLILIKLKLMWYVIVCFAANLICDRKILLTANSSYKLDLSAFE